jgi:predicted phosphoadenosine phosphosulfate sulfurtransferase
VKIFLKQNVWDAALERVNWLFDEFDNIIVNVSGGKDSTVVWNLALIVAGERGRLPLKTFFIDQEAEWQATIDHMRLIMSDPRVDPIWLQIPIKLFNATSTLDPWLYCWEEGKEWMREKEAISWKVNRYGTDRFAELFNAFSAVEFPSQDACCIAGVRCEESPARRLGLTTYDTYKGATWGRVTNKSTRHYTMYPIYDWTYVDVWKAIHDHGWPYCRLYDYMYQYGISVRNMRVSNIHHETALTSLFYLQEVEGDTWEKVTRRLSGINTVGQMQGQFFKPVDLPFMFKDWFEYRDHLLENLITDRVIREKMHRQFIGCDKHYEGKALEDLVRTEIACVLVNDYHGTKLSTFHAAHMMDSKNRGRLSGRTN